MIKTQCDNCGWPLNIAIDTTLFICSECLSTCELEGDLENMILLVRDKLGYQLTKQEHDKIVKYIEV